jgi:hypothetical protein
MFLFFLPPRIRQRYAPLIRIGYGLVAVALGFVILSKILWAAGALLIVWGIVSGLTRSRRRRRDNLDGLTER